MQQAGRHKNGRGMSKDEQITLNVAGRQTGDVAVIYHSQ
jgi:hypothetical protein